MSLEQMISTGSRGLYFVAQVDEQNEQEALKSLDVIERTDDKM